MIIAQILLIFGCFFLLIWITNQVTEYLTPETTFCRAKDGVYYQVRNLKDRQAAADLMARINRRIKTFLQYLRKKHYNNQDILRLYRNYNEHQLCEASLSGQHTSYSINKGEKMIFCLRHRAQQQQRGLWVKGAPPSKGVMGEGVLGPRMLQGVLGEGALPQFVDINTIMFVVIHELAHLMSHSIGHTKEFWGNMKFLLKEALDCPHKIYRYVPYHSNPVQYCGIVISDTPYKK